MAHTARQRRAGVYFIVSPSGSIYIGSSTELDRRKVKHFGDLKRGNHHCKGLQNAFNKYCADLQFYIVERCEPEKVYEREQWWLDNWRIFTAAIYNSSTFAHHTEQTLEIRERISTSKIGKTKSVETRLKMSASKKGIKFSPEHIENLRKSHIGKVSTRKGKPGKPMSDETREKIRLAHKGKLKSEAHKAALRKPHKT